MIEPSVKKSEELTASVAAPPLKSRLFSRSSVEVLPATAECRSFCAVGILAGCSSSHPPPAVAKFQPASGIDPIQTSKFKAFPCSLPFHFFRFCAESEW